MDNLMRERVEETDAPSGIPLDLTPVLSPYLHDPNFSLRIEHLPDHARLSRGRNNGDHTWSLTKDDLDGLFYLPPKGMGKIHAHGIRIAAVEVDGAVTVAHLDFPAPPDKTACELIPHPAAKMSEANDSGDEELHRLREKLVRLQVGLATPAENVEQGCAARQAEAEDHLANKEAQNNLSRAEEAWRCEEEARLAAAETEGREQSAHFLTVARLEQPEATDHLAQMEAQAETRIKEAEAARERGGEELRRVRGELAAVTAALSSCDIELTETKQHLDHARTEGTKQAVAAELAAARAAWDAELEKRLAQAAAAAAANLEQSRAAWQAEAADRLAQIEAHAEMRLKEAGALWQRLSHEALAQAAEAWRNEEAARLAAAEAQWREQSARAFAAAEARAGRAEAALKEARAQAETAREQGGEGLHRLREELIARLRRSTDVILQV